MVCSDYQKYRQSYWDHFPIDKPCTVPLPRYWLAKYVDRAAILLDYGCGYGRAAPLLQAMGYDAVIGMDIALPMLQRAHAEYPELSFVQNQQANIPLATHAVDMIVVIAVITYFVADHELNALLNELQRVLKPGGKLIIGDFLLNRDARNMARYDAVQAQMQAPYGVFRLPEGVYCRHFSESAIQTQFSRFNTLDFTECNFTTINGNTSRGFYALLENKI